MTDEAGSPDAKARARARQGEETKRMIGSAEIACPCCGHKWRRASHNAEWRMAVFRATPREVWDAYAEDGISLHDAWNEEMTYA